jgi:hypothetical protein
VAWCALHEPATAELGERCLDGLLVEAEHNGDLPVCAGQRDCFEDHPFDVCERSSS